MHRNVLFAAAVSVLLAVVGAGCGGSGTKSHPASVATAVAQTDAAVKQSSLARTAKLPLSSLYRDEDDDDGEGEERGHSSGDTDADGDDDRPRPGYYDRDDAGVRDFGHIASPADHHALTRLTRRYYGAAAAENGAEACALLSRPFTSIVVEDYGHGSAGPRYLSGGTTCPAVLTLLFQHFHAKLNEPIEIIGTRVSGDTALVLIGAAGIPASDLEAHREGGAWRVVGMLASSLQ